MAIVTAAAPFAAYRGRIERLFFYTDRQGVVHLRPGPQGDDPNTPDQGRARGDLSNAARLWATLTDDERARWVAYGESVGRQGYRAYTGLALKYRRLHPDARPPSEPPSEPFFGDNAGISAAAPEGTHGIVRFAARRANQPGVAVELIVQRLVVRHRTPKPRDWRSHGFVHFTDGDLAADLELPSGAYALAFRYVSVLDGRETPMADLGRATVG